MKIKRYVAADIRAALRAIREEQGADAVILSTRRTSEGVEVCSAIDLELAAGQGTLAETAALKQLERTAMHELERDAAESSAPTAPTAQAALADALLSSAPIRPAVAAAEYGADRRVADELRSLRNLLEQQVAALAWNDFTRREPLKARSLADLATLGIERTLALQIVSELPASLTDEQAQRTPYAVLARRIQTCTPPVERAGAVALIGPPGSGKTTTLSKLAARYVLEQDAANLVLISADDERLGSQEQLRSLGRVLGARVETVTNLEALEARIKSLPGRMILIDTPGVAGRDGDAAAQFAALRSRCSALQLMLVLPSSAQSGVIEETVTHFGPAVSHCCALTRLDESVSLGGVLSALAHSQLPLAYVCDGPVIPDDLRPARAHQLVTRAIELSRQAQGCADDELLARRYGANLNAAG